MVPEQDIMERERVGGIGQPSYLQEGFSSWLARW